MPEAFGSRGPGWVLALLALAPVLGLAVACSGHELKLGARVLPIAVLSRVTAAMAPSVVAKSEVPLRVEMVARVAETVPNADVAPNTAEAPPPVAEAPSPVAESPSSVADAPPPVAETPAADSAEAPIELVATARETLVFAEPTRRSNKVGYLRLGARVGRSSAAVGYDGCPLGWYRVAPFGFVCAGNAASREMPPELAGLVSARADREAALPYTYGRSKPVPPPLYPRLPTPAETLSLEGPSVRGASGFADLPLRPLPPTLADGQPLPVPFGFARPDPLAIPRAVPNSAFALLDVFERGGRRFGLTSDLEFVPLDRLTRVEPSAFHGIVLGDETTLPVVFVRARHAALYAGSPTRGLRQVRSLGYREAVAVTERSEKIDGLRYLETRDGLWLRDADLVRVTARPNPPPGVREGHTWIHVSVVDQTLVAYVGSKPVYATLVSTGAGGMGDPETTHATPRGEFLIHTKHVTATMNGDELGDEFDLRDVPYVEYFTQGYAFHAAFWHDAFGAAHSHGCVNLSPLDARWLFHFTEPAVPQGWHGAFSREGTLVSITQ